MDTATHALIGALAIQAIPPRLDRAALTSGERMVVAAAAAAFPDLDYLGFWIDPYTFLTQWHRGLSHSLVMLPIWAVVLGIICSAVAGRQEQWRAFVGPCAVGLLSHSVADITTVFGTQLFAPFHDYRTALSITFDFDPWITVIAGISLAVAVRWRSSARWGCVALLCYLAVHVAMQRTALGVARTYALSRGLDEADVYAVPQPLFPFHWKLVVSTGDDYAMSYLNLFGDTILPVLPAASLLSSMMPAYRSKHRLLWQQHNRFGNSRNTRALAREVWNQDALSGFRRFAALPILYRIDRDTDRTCVWFTDVRYVLPALTAPFRYGMCRFDAESPWRLYRLRRFSDNDRQWLGW